MDIQRERLITKVLEQPLEELLRQLDTNEVQVLFIYINKVGSIYSMTPGNISIVP